MAYENPMEGPPIPPQATEEVNHGATHARKAMEDLGSAADVTADEYRHRAQGAWEGALHRARSFQDDGKQYVRENPNEGGLYRARRRFRPWFNFPSLKGR
jgi:hypothetical protein